MPNFRDSLERLRRWSRELRHRRRHLRSIPSTQTHPTELTTSFADEGSAIGPNEPFLEPQQPAARVQHHLLRDNGPMATLNEEGALSAEELTGNRSENSVPPQLELSDQEQRRIVLRELDDGLRRLEEFYHEINQRIMASENLTDLYEETRQRVEEINTRFDELVRQVQDIVGEQANLPRLTLRPLPLTRDNVVPAPEPHNTAQPGARQEADPEPVPEVQPEPVDDDEVTTHQIHTNALHPGETITIYTDLPANLGRGAAAAILARIAEDMRRENRG